MTAALYLLCPLLALFISETETVLDLTTTVVNIYDGEFGVYLGDLTTVEENSDIRGRVYVINETALQLINFNYKQQNSDVYFWLDRSESPTSEGIKVPTIEFGVTPLGDYMNVKRVILVLPGLYKIKQFKSFSLYSHANEKAFSTSIIPENLVEPKPQFLDNELQGSRYSVRSGPILIVDRRTVKVYGFTFDGDKAPDGYFFVGRGPKVDRDTGVKVAIRGRDEPEMITAMNERYRGGKDIILDLPEEYDINHIDWLSVYCYKFHVDFGHVLIGNLSHLIPPYLPLPFDGNEKVESWSVVSLLGTEDRHNFTFQLGLPGGKKGYQYIARARPGNHVWYVNGYLAEIYLKRGVTYNFIIEGGNDKSTEAFYNPLYITDDAFGGYWKLSSDERKQVKIFAGQNADETAGRLCLWSTTDKADDPDNYSSFIEYRKTLKLHCTKESKPAVMQFLATDNTPDTLYYQSYSLYNMGWKIHIVNDLPKDIADFHEEPYEYDVWLQRETLMKQVDETSSRAPIKLDQLQSFIFILTILLILS